jgi:hypothetical protein
LSISTPPASVSCSVITHVASRAPSAVVNTQSRSATPLWLITSRGSQPGTHSTSLTGHRSVTTSRGVPRRVCR